VGSQCKAAENKYVEALFVRSTEAESIKLFANNYLAMRLSFFNELGFYALANGLSARNIVDCVSPKGL
jgi:UDPglucose 6-dehydrogenase